MSMCIKFETRAKIGKEANLRDYLDREQIIAGDTFLYMRGSTCSDTSTRSVWLMQRISLPTWCLCTVSLRLSYQLRKPAHPSRKAICVVVCVQCVSSY